MKTHPILSSSLFALAFMSSQSFASAKLDKLLLDAEKAALEHHQETEKAMEPYLSKEDSTDDSQEKNDNDDDDSDSPLAGGTKAKAAPAASSGYTSGTAAASNTQNRVKTTGEVGASGGANQIKFDKKPAIPSDAVY